MIMMIMPYRSTFATKECNATLNKDLTNISSLRPTVRPDNFGSEELDIENSPKREARYLSCCFFTIRPILILACNLNSDDQRGEARQSENRKKRHR